MPLLSANGFAVVEAVLFFPRVGPWHGDLLIDAPSSQGLTGKVTLSLDDGAMTFVGTPARAGEFIGSRRMRIVAGADGLATLATPRYYRQGATVQVVLSDLLGQAGETLAADADSGTLGMQLVPGWTTLAQPVGVTLANLLAVAAPAGTVWRFEPNGTLWIGQETWPAIPSTVQYDILNSRPELKLYEIGIAAPTILPGVTLPDGRRVASVEMHLSEKGVREVLYLDDAQADPT